MTFADAIESAIAQAMAEDPTVVIYGEDVHMLRVNLYSRFGGKRVVNMPISESAFLGAGVSAAMAGLRPIVEIMLIDFLGVAMDGLLNHAAKTKAFSGGKWNVPMVIRASCGGGYGDGGQHEQALWGWLAHIPGISVVVPSTPADAGGMMLTAIRSDDPVVFLEHKLLADYWLDYLGSGGRKGLDYSVPQAGLKGEVPAVWSPVAFGEAAVRREGSDLTVAGVGVGMHRALEAADILASDGHSLEVIDLRTVAPLDVDTIRSSVEKTGKLLVVDEDYRQFGLSGEIAACLLEEGVHFDYARVCVDDTIPYDHTREMKALPNAERILESSLELIARSTPVQANSGSNDR
jgi:pyruvate dehydrogenase E1 component beta subunit